MIAFLLACLKPEAVLMLFVAGASLRFACSPKAGLSLIWLFVGILAIVSWAFVVF